MIDAKAAKKLSTSDWQANFEQGHEQCLQSIEDCIRYAAKHGDKKTNCTIYGSREELNMYERYFMLLGYACNKEPIKAEDQVVTLKDERYETRWLVRLFW